MMKQTILIIEDETKIAQLLADYLTQANFEVTILDRGDTVVDQVQKSLPNIILLDLALPGKDGITICKEIRRFSDIPIIMITARIEEIDRLLGLELGADDYICKPFSPREVVARVKAVLRRLEKHQESSVLNIGPITINTETRVVTVAEKTIDLTPSEFKLLSIFMEKPERVFTRDDLTLLIQGYEFEGYDRTIDTHIKNLRKKIAEQIPDQTIIHTIYGVGYKLSLE
jgi:two-component system, OmpR family, response regulator BaeR